ncbi:MAG: thioredoxin family protein [Planctomycetes bacterium]|nr:thioredoxin family protein [Planctomycetota bacterium]
MVAITAQLMMQVAMLTTGGSPYQEAYRQAERQGKPFLVLVGAAWCPGCQTMKNKNLPELNREGGLKQVVYTLVDSDEKPTLAGELLRGKSIPQLVLYTPTSHGKERRWRRAQLTGVHDAAAIKAFLKKAIAGESVVAQGGG